MVPVLRQTLHVPWATRAVRRSRAIERAREREERGPYKAVEERLASVRQDHMSSRVVLHTRCRTDQLFLPPQTPTSTSTSTLGRGGKWGACGGIPRPPNRECRKYCSLRVRPRLSHPSRDNQEPWQAPRRSQPALGPAWPAACAMRCAPALLPVAFRSDRSPLPTVSHRARTRVRRRRRRGESQV